MRYLTSIPSSLSRGFRQRVHHACEAAACTGETLTYQDLAETVIGDADRGSADRRFIRLADAALCENMRDDVREGRPLSAVAVRQALSGLPGDEFYTQVWELGRFTGEQDAQGFVSDEWQAYCEHVAPGSQTDESELPVETIISGGQTGADRGALIAARRCSIGTGGWMPRGFRALDGDHPEFALRYGIREHTSRNYPPRTRMNVRSADGTIRIATTFDSPGERLTLRAIRQYDTPLLDIDASSPLSVAMVRDWLRQHGIRTLNVAGNSERTSPGIQQFITDYLSRVLAA